jgi:isopenicillin N synthase-like dioxygenase
MREYRTATTAYYAAMEAMTTRLVPIVAMALDLPPDYFAQVFAELNCTIRLIHRFGSSRLGPGSNHASRLRPAHTLTDEEIDRPPVRHVVRIGLRAIGQQLVVFR